MREARPKRPKKQKFLKPLFHVPWPPCQKKNIHKVLYIFILRNNATAHWATLEVENTKYWSQKVFFFLSFWNRKYSQFMSPACLPAFSPPFKVIKRNLPRFYGCDKRNNANTAVVKLCVKIAWRNWRTCIN